MEEKGRWIRGAWRIAGWLERGTEAISRIDGEKGEEDGED